MERMTFVVNGREWTHNELEELAWSRLPLDLKYKASAYLQSQFGTKFFDDVRAAIDSEGLGNWLPAHWHFYQGMEIRNVLREIIKDKELPPLPEWYGPYIDEGNWDDYYVQVIEYAAGKRAL